MGETHQSLQGSSKMLDARRLPATVKFGMFEVNLESREVRKRGLRMRLEEKPFQILELLLESPGHVVSRSALREKLWPDTHVGFDHSLNTAINKLRGLLGDSAESPRFVETIPRRGYRFIGALEMPVRTAPISSKKMLVVLPFENICGDEEQEYFADGLMEELTLQLGMLHPKRLGVIARTSSLPYKRTKKSISEIARELGVDCVLEGSVRCGENRVRITVQLIEAGTQSHLWAASYDRDLRDILEVQNDVARQVGKALAIELLPMPVAEHAAPDPAAHEAYLRGRFYFGQRTEDALQKAITSFETALSIENDCARSYAGIADCYSLLCWYGAYAPAEAGPKAAAAANRAIAIDASLCEPHASLALVKYWYEWNWREAETEFLRAMELNPSYATAHLWYASYLNTMGRLQEATAAQRNARELDPLSPVISMSAADPFFYAREYDLALAHLRLILEQAPRFFPALFNIGRVYVQKGMYGNAILAFEKAVELSGNREGLPALAHAYALAGRTAEARNILAEMKRNAGGRYVAAPMIARVHLGLGEIDEALEWLSKGIAERSFWTIFLKMDPVYDGIRSDTRFQELLKRVGLDR
jgi:TolB-like protein/Flp pilus assembly protein TadD